LLPDELLISQLADSPLFTKHCSEEEALWTDPLTAMEDSVYGIQYINVDIDVQEILLAASQHNIPKLRQLIRENQSAENPANAKDPETGYTSLHSAIAACEPDSEEPETAAPNGTSTTTTPNAEASADVIQAGRETVKFLLQEGAIWNDLDAKDETPGCLARRLGLNELYELMVDAGVRAEMLLNRLGQYDQLEDTNEENEAADETNATQTETTAESPGTAATATTEQPVTSSRYLQSRLAFRENQLLDDDQNGVMMSWESDIMSKSARALLPCPGLRVINVGFGMGFMDSRIQALQPSSHHIVEAHPAVLADMRSKGWYEKPGVVIHEGKWQHVMPKLVEEGLTFDAIYYDTFAESYSDFRDFFSEQVIGLLEPEGRWSFFNGMGADRQISYDVYQKVVEMDLLEAGFDVDWEEIDVPSLEGEWSGVRRKYWVIDKYRLPVCKYTD
jgi:protein arginine N-methyltransferase 2